MLQIARVHTYHKRWEALPLRGRVPGSRCSHGSRSSAARWHLQFKAFLGGWGASSKRRSRTAEQCVDASEALSFLRRSTQNRAAFVRSIESCPLTMASMIQSPRLRASTHPYCLLHKEWTRKPQGRRSGMMRGAWLYAYTTRSRPRNASVRDTKSLNHDSSNGVINSTPSVGKASAGAHRTSGFMSTRGLTDLVEGT